MREYVWPARRTNQMSWGCRDASMASSNIMYWSSGGSLLKRWNSVKGGDRLHSPKLRIEEETLRTVWLEETRLALYCARAV